MVLAFFFFKNKKRLRQILTIANLRAIMQRFLSVSNFCLCCSDVVWWMAAILITKMVFSCLIFYASAWNDAATVAFYLNSLHIPINVKIIIIILNNNIWWQKQRICCIEWSRSMISMWYTLKIYVATNITANLKHNFAMPKNNAFKQLCSQCILLSIDILIKFASLCSLANLCPSIQST